jgi:hypothetical protein
MSTIVLRSAKGSPLTNAEVDANFTNLNNDKTQLGGTYSSGTANGVLFLSPSKVLTTGSALTFDGSSMVLNTSTSSSALRITQLGAGNALLVEDTTNPDSTPFVIDNNGTVIAGYTGSVVTAGSAVAPRMQVHGLGGGGASSGVTSWSTGGNVGPSVVLSRSEGGVVGTHAVVDSGDHLGNIRFAGSDGTAFIEAAKITGEVDGTPGLNAMPGRLVFSTTAAGASTPTERLRLNSSGATVTGDLTLSSGTANGVAYLNGSKVLTTGSALTFDGTTFATTGFGRFGNGGRIEGTGSALAGTGVGAEIFASGNIAYYTSYDRTGAAYSPLISIAGSYQAWNVSGEQMRLTSTGLGIGTSSPSNLLQTKGSSAAQMGVYRTNSTTGVGVGFEYAQNNASSAETVIAQTFGVLTTNTAGAESGAFTVWTKNAGTLAERMRIDSSGNLGLGVTPSAWSGSGPGQKVLQLQSFAISSDVNTSYHTNNAVYTSGGNWFYLASKPALRVDYDAALGQYRWYNAPSGTAGNAISFTQAMTLDASGNLGLGTTTPGCRIDILSPNNTSLDPTIRVNSNNAAVNTALSYDGLVGSNQLTVKAGTSSALIFGSNNTERARIDSSGNLLVGYSSGGPATGPGVVKAAAYNTKAGYGAALGVNLFNINWSGSTAALYIDTTNVGNISLTSDYRIKQKIETQTAPALERVMQLRPVTYELQDYRTLFKADGIAREGFIAHELQTVIPSAVEGEKDAENQVQSLKLDALVSVLTKAIQEQQAIITALTARVAALESN